MPRASPAGSKPSLMAFWLTAPLSPAQSPEQGGSDSRLMFFTGGAGGAHGARTAWHRCCRSPHACFPGRQRVADKLLRYCHDAPCTSLRAMIDALNCQKAPTHPAPVLSQVTTGIRMSLAWSTPCHSLLRLTCDTTYFMHSFDRPPSTTSS